MTFSQFWGSFGYLMALMIGVYLVAQKMPRRDHFALRMAVGDVLCSQEPLPVVLDDVFAMYDEERLMETLQWLIEHKQQVLVFTCHKREEQILNAYGMHYHRVDVFDK